MDQSLSNLLRSPRRKTYTVKVNFYRLEWSTFIVIKQCNSLIQLTAQTLLARNRSLVLKATNERAHYWE